LWQNGFYLGDLEGDGRFELIHGTPRKKNQPPSVFSYVPGAGWQLRGGFTFPDLNYQYGDLVVGDFNGDSYPDFALGMHLSGIEILFGARKGVFKHGGSLLNVGDPFSSKELVAADMNLDGQVDLVAAGEGKASSRVFGDRPGSQSRGIRVFTATSTGKWVYEVLPGTERYFSDAMIVGEINGDTFSDIVFAPRASRQGVVIARGAEDRWDVRQQIPADVQFVWGLDLLPQRQQGRGDSLVIVSSSRVSGSWKWVIGMQRPDQKVEGYREIFIEPSGALAGGIAVGEINGDSVPDIVALTDNGEMRFLVSSGECGFLTNLYRFKHLAGCKGYTVVMKDLNKDGLDEVVANFAREPHGKRCPSGGGIVAVSPEKTGAASRGGAEQ
jgi:hypothetical protein